MAYTKYKPENVILPYNKFPSYQQIEKIQPVEKIQPYTPYRGWDDERRAVLNARKNKQVETFLSNYNDPTELNSYIDALTNREAVSKKFGDAWGTISTVSGTAAVLSFAGAIIAAALAPVTGGASLAVAAPLAKAGAIAALPAIPAAADVTIEKGIKPILAGKPKEAFLNTLMNLGETADYVSNPIKGLLLEGGKGFIKGTGLAEGGRVNYDFDTGFFLTDMLLEVVSDPMNWVQFGTNAAMKTATKTIGETVSKEIVDTTVDVVNNTFAKALGEISTEGAERITDQVTKTAAKVSREWAEASFKELTDEAKKRLIRDGKDRIQRTLVRALQKELPEVKYSEVRLILNYSNENAIKGKVLTSAFSKIDNLTMDTLSSNVIKGLAGIQHYTDTFEKFMTKNALRTSGFGLGIEFAKEGWKGIKAWQNNFTLNRLEKAGYFNKKAGVDFSKWKDTKALWEASQDYTTEIAGVVSQRDKNALYKLANEQLNRDLDIVKEIAYGKGTPLEKIAELNNRFTELYGYNFETYIKYLKGVNDSENGIFKSFINYYDNTATLLNMQSYAMQQGVKSKTGAQLMHSSNVKSFVDYTNKVKEQLPKTLTVEKNKLKNSNKFYTVKINDARFNAFLLNDPVIDSVMMSIADSKNIGSILEKIINDSRIYSKAANASLSSAAKTVKQAGGAFKNLKQLFNEIGQSVISVNKISADDFKNAIIDILTGTRLNVSSALAGFDNVTMPEIMHKLELMFYDNKTGTYLFKASEHPEIQEQIANIYRTYLKAQQDLELEVTDAAIIQRFTESIDLLNKNLPEYAEDLAPLTVANTEIYDLMSLRKGMDFDLVSTIIADEKTIFDIFKVNSIRELSDAGLALKTVDVQKVLDMFNIPAEASGNIVLSVRQLGNQIRYYKEQIQQYSVQLTAENIKKLNQTYTKFYNKIIRNPKLQSEFSLPAFSLLKRSKNPSEQLAQLIVFNKMDKSKNLTKWFNISIADDNDIWYKIKRPDQMFVTDFAWDAQKQSKWIAQKQLNEDIINPMKAYHDLSSMSEKITHDFQEFRKTLSDTGLDKPQALQYERYIKSLSEINDMLKFLENYYKTSFDRTLAETKIEELRGLLLQFSELDEKYSDLVDTLEDYWNGTKEFAQSSKALKGTDEFVDEFTPFWEQIKEMNADIHRVLRGKSSYTDITPWDPYKDIQELNKAINKATDINAKGAMYNLFTLTPEEFKQELACRYRFITFKDEDIAEGQLKYIFEKLKHNSDNTVKFMYDEKSHRHWIYLDKGQKVNANGRQIYLNNNPVIRKQFKKEFNEFEIVDKIIKDPNNPGITKTLNNLDNTLYELTGSHLGSSQGEYMSKETLQKIWEQMPDEVKQAIDINKITDKQFFEAYLFNESVLGSMHSKAELGMYSGNMITNARNALIQSQSYTKAKTEYTHAVFNSQSSISNPNGIFANYTNEELCEALQANPEYKLVTLVDDKKHGMKTFEILPTSPKAIAKAKELGAVIIPTQTYKEMYGMINKRIGSTGAAKWWNRFIYMYKFGYLCRPGAWIRNFIDTNLKTKLELGDEYSSYIAQAHKMLNDVDAMYNYIDHLDPDGLIKSDAIKEWFEKGNAKYLDYETFLELDRDFLSKGIAGNITNILDKDDTAKGAWRSFTHATGDILNTANKAEDYNRLAMYLYELDRGLDYSSALSKIAKTHFDYSFKTKAEQLVEMVFPFTTFSLRNFSYWIEKMEKHPWLLSNYIHLMKPHWDFKDYTPEELARDKRVQTQILYGQLKLAEFNNKVLTFKANPSIQDAIQMFSDPINNVYEKLAAPIKMATGQEAPSIGSIPMVGPALQAIQTTTKTGSPVPSVIGVQQAPKRTGKAINFTNTNLSGTDKYTDSTYRTPKYRNNTNFDSYKTKGITGYRKNFYPVVDIAHDIKMRYSVNVANRIKNRVKTDIYQGIRYRIRLDANRFRS